MADSISCSYPTHQNNSITCLCWWWLETVFNVDMVRKCIIITMPTQLRSTLDNTRVFALWHIYIRAELMTGHLHDWIAIVYLQELHCDHLRLYVINEPQCKKTEQCRYVTRNYRTHLFSLIYFSSPIYWNHMYVTPIPQYRLGFNNLQHCIRIQWHNVH